MSQNLKSKRTAVFISGAGRGFGKACALSAAKFFHNNSLLLLCGRNLENLNKTKELVKKENATIKCEVFQLDLGKVNADEVKGILEKVLNLDQVSYECFLMIHNACLLGDVKKFSYEFTDNDTVQSIVSTNLVGTILVNNLFLDQIKRKCKDPNTLIIIVNISSPCAVDPLPTTSIYSATKAGREMFFRCIFSDWTRKESLKMVTFSYIPGSMTSDMMMDLINNGIDAELTAELTKLKDNGELLDPSVCSEKLFHHVLDNYPSFDAGSRVDYEDL